MPIDDLDALRAEIDALDHQLLALLAARLDVARTIGKLKIERGMAVTQPEREATLLVERERLAETLGMDPALARALFENLLAWSKTAQRRDQANRGDRS